MGGSTVSGERFEEHRPRLRAVAYRMLGSLDEAEDAVREARLRPDRTGGDDVRDPGDRLTAAVARICLDRLRARAARREEPLLREDGRVRLPDPVVSRASGPGPEQAALAADEGGFALMTVLDTLAPAERLAFVLHDLFAVPSEDVARVLDRTAASARQLADRARHRVRAAAPPPDGDAAGRREVVEAFLAAARDGDLDALVAVLDPDVVARSDGGTLRPSVLRRGAATVASQAVVFARLAETAHPVLVNGAPGVLTVSEGRAVSVMSFTIHGSRVTCLDILTDPGRLVRLDVDALVG
ncbi:RNA polymerase subunit sigma-70 [Streptomyces somaliensis DSM 40738]|uniref:RNA polymerase subunit sigma-70 n=1 Tax=Streptomyces somaliensis (strain ATCC 33201 / DSM 40738 / JCM 12659 / KCTC 9044 / NCTC 11332 / NRRL B-12077 / IP 733) TaxID=1134445 RepID=A0AA44IFL3_STRE0|nr:sigma factor-like helix-turn-helix DNA-binding protein [Streptomyces somaliensis]MCQ0024621.1 RNA polymerase subunit sigma-70 [Streptomyces somaliensis DSM 40738]NKY16568.1 RNA polymerase subunit sigma-70 [Streptomyces somaliensis DSM 40738]